MEIRRIRCGNVNSYLIAKGKNAILVDTGREAYRQQVLDACQGFQMRLLVLTHGHIDHVQNAAFLSETLQIPVAMNRKDALLLNDNMLQPLHARGLFGKIVLAASLKSFKKDKIASFVPAIFLEDSDTLDSYGIPARVIELPGHTKGSIGLDIGQKYLLAGDALMNMFYPTVSILYNNKDAMLQSAEKIGSLGERTIYFGHGKPMQNRQWV